MGKYPKQYFVQISTREEVLMAGFVVSLYIAPSAHAPMNLVTTAHLVPGRGIEGDRFYDHRENEDANGDVMYDVTLVEQEAIQHIREERSYADPGASARRNIVVHGVSLKEFVGRTFSIGEVTLQGLERHDSCFSEDIDQADACNMLRSSDLGARILTEGMISIGDRIQEAQ
jgi:MOSC domain-containing protein YiiM